MAAPKTASFSEEDIQRAAWARALSHPARLAILRALAARQTCCCGDLVADLPLAQATVSQHLKVLKEAGLIEGEVEGPRVCYCLSPEALSRLRQAFGTFFDELERPATCC